MRIIFVEKDNIDLISYILYLFPNIPITFLYKALRSKDIKVNEKRISKTQKLFKNDKLQIYISDNILFNVPNKLNYIYIDNNILVVFKPQGILSNAKSDDTPSFEPTLETLVVKDYTNAKICHRLDRNTSGLVIFALNEDSYKEILGAFKNGNVVKEYFAYVANSNFIKDTDTLNKFIYKDSKTGFCKIYDNKVPGSKQIITKYNIIQKFPKEDFATLQILIHTGRTHQIRAQMASIFHPIIGDSKYGKNEINRKFKINKQLLFAIKYSFNFNLNSSLYYLNNKTIELDKAYYEKKLGCGFNESKDTNIH